MDSLNKTELIKVFLLSLQLIQFWNFVRFYLLIIA